MPEECSVQVRLSRSRPSETPALQALYHSALESEPFHHAIDDSLRRLLRPGFTEKISIVDRLADVHIDALSNPRKPAADREELIHPGNRHGKNSGLVSEDHETCSRSTPSDRTITTPRALRKQDEGPLLERSHGAVHGFQIASPRPDRDAPQLMEEPREEPIAKEVLLRGRVPWNEVWTAEVVSIVCAHPDGEAVDHGLMIGEQEGVWPQRNAVPAEHPRPVEHDEDDEEYGQDEVGHNKVCDRPQ